MTHRSRVLLFAIPLLLSLLILAPFALRHGVPGFHHDWLWPANQRGFWLRFVQNLSTWNPFGLGGALDAPTVNYFGALCWLLSVLGFSSQWVLLIVLALLFSIGQWGIAAARSAFGIALGSFETLALGFAYAFGPVCFQKFAAGHLYFIAAYQMLPLFAAMVWRSTRVERDWWRWAIAAGLLLSIMETQIQYIGFGAFVAAVLILASGGSIARSLACFGTVISLALLHVATLFLNIGGNETVGLISGHANRVWELDLSAAFSKLLALGGYVGYDTAALPGELLPAYAWARWAAVLTAIAGLLVSRRTRAMRRVAIGWAIIGLFALVWANGSYGPFGPLFDAALHRTVLFTIVRELYHVMALYALAVIMLAAIALAWLPRIVARAIAAAIVLTTLPFATFGANRLVPAVPETLSASTACTGARNLCALLPIDQPIGPTDDPRVFGIDPATLVPNSINGGALPFIHYALVRLAVGDERPAAALGVSEARWRPGISSHLPEVFEPHVGAEFGAFLKGQRVLQRALASPITLNATPSLYVEPENASSILDGLAGASEPAGVGGSFTSSFENNGIRTSWVLGTLWAWQFPAFTDMSSTEFVLTESASELPITVQHSHGAFLYILGVARRPMLGGRAPMRMVSLKAGPYAWYEWSVDPRQTTFSYRSGAKASAVSRAIFSNVGNWKPLRPNTTRRDRTLVDARSEWPWSVSGTLPTLQPHATMRLVFAQMFSNGWHLFVNGRDMGPPTRTHAFFNGWNLRGARSGEPFAIVRVQQLYVNLWDGGSTAVSAILAALLLVSRRRRAIAAIGSRASLEPPEA